MNEQPTRVLSLEEQVDDAVATYLDAAARGEAPAAERFLAGFPPTVAAELKQFLEDWGYLDRLIPPANPMPLGVYPTPAQEGPVGVPLILGYKVHAILGRGGMGVVYRAEQLKLKRFVALKMILAGPHADSEDLLRFQAEAEAVARLKHDHIVQIYEINEHDRRPFFSLELLDGGSLDRKLAGHPQPPRQAADLVEKLARGIQAAHEQGIVHRDLKPANVLLTADGTPKITDFGLAKQLDVECGQTRTGAIMGTPSYMAPEQASGQIKEVGPAADIYALGGILYAMLTGRPPFQAATVLDTLEQVRNQEPVPPSRFQPRLPRDLETICLKCLHKEPMRRYPSAAELAKDLRRFLAGEPIHARPVSRLERTWKWARRRPALAALMVVSVSALVGTIFGLIWNDFQTRNFNRDLRAENLERVKAEGEARVEAGRARKAEKDAEERRRDAEEKKKAAEKAKTEEEKARKEEVKATKKAQDEERKSRERSVRLLVGTWQRLLDEGDLHKAMLYAAEALALDDPEALSSIKHQCRLAAALRQSPRLLEDWPHPQPVMSATFSPDGRRILTACRDGRARLWDTGNGRLLNENDTPAHEKSVNIAIFSPDGRRYLTASDDQTVRVWDGTTGQPLGEPIKLRRPVTHVAFSPDGRYWLAAMGNKYDQSRQQQLPPIMVPQRVGNTTIMVPQPSGGTTTVQPLGQLQIFDTDTGKPVGPPLTQRGWANDAQFSADSQFVVMASGYMEGDSSAVVRDLECDVPLGERIRHRWHMNRVCFSPDGRRLVIACGTPGVDGGEAFLWDLANEETIGRPMKHAAPVTHAEFSPDGRRIVTAGWDGVARVWDAASGEPLTPALTHKDRLSGAWFSPDARRVLTAGWDGAARVWDAQTGKQLTPALWHDGPITHAEFSPNGSRVLTAGKDGNVRLWDLTAPFEQIVLRHHTILSPGPIVSRQVVQGQTVRSEKTLGDLIVTQACFSPDGKTIITGSGSRTVQLIPGGGAAYAGRGMQTSHISAWDGKTGSSLLTPWRSPGLASPVVLSRDGRWLLASEESPDPFGGSSVLRMYEVWTGKEVANFTVPKNGSLKEAAFRGDGRCLLVMTVPRQGPANKPLPGIELQVIDLVKGTSVVPPIPLEEGVTQVALNGDADKLAAILLKSTPLEQRQVRLEWTARVWDLANGGKAIGEPLPHRQVVSRIAVSPDGRQVLTYSPGRSALSPVASLTTDGEAAAYLWQVKEGKVAPLRHSSTVTHAAFSPDGSRVVTCSADRTARVWSSADARPATPPLEHQAQVNFAAFGPNGVLATASNDNTARIWDAATGEAISPPLRHRDWVNHVSFSSDGRRVVTAGCDGTARIWDFSLPRRSAEELRELAQLLARHRIDATRGLSALERDEFETSWKRLRRRSPTDFLPSDSSIRTWRVESLEEAREAGDWFATRVHLDHLINAAPKNWQLRSARGDAFARLEQWEKGAADFVQAVTLGSDNIDDGRALALLQAHAGKIDDYRRTCKQLLERFGNSGDPQIIDKLLRVCALAPDAVSEYGPLVTLAEKAAAPKDPRQKPAPNRILGRIYFRAGRHEDAVRNLPNAYAEDSVFLAMAQHRLNRNDEARKTVGSSSIWLERMLERIPQSRRPWQAILEFRILLQEAEVVVR